MLCSYKKQLVTLNKNLKISLAMPVAIHLLHVHQRAFMQQCRLTGIKFGIVGGGEQKSLKLEVTDDNKPVRCTAGAIALCMIAAI